MAEVPVDTAEKIESEIGHRRRNSTGNVETSAGKQKVLPHYLRASAGSCHDMCKYGCTSDARLLSKSLQNARTGDLQKRNKSPGNTKPPLDMISRKANQLARQATVPIVSKPSMPWKMAGISSSSAPQHRRQLSDSVFSRSLQNTDKNALVGSGSGRNDGFKVINEVGSSTFGNKKARVLPEGSRTAKSSANKVLRNQDVITKFKARKCSDKHPAEKTLHSVEPKPESQIHGSMNHSSDSSLSHQSASFNERTCQDEATTSELVQSSETSQYIKADSTDEIRSQVSRDGTEDSDDSPRKKMFQKGRAINVQQDKTSPRKLEFRAHNVLTENGNFNTDAAGQSLRKAETAESRLNGTRHECEPINLRHQTVEEKKGCSSLYNNMIEETANKLVRTKKSKVKALVGAFESVMSLLDTNNSRASTR